MEEAYGKLRKDQRIAGEEKAMATLLRI